MSDTTTDSDTSTETETATGCKADDGEAEPTRSGEQGPPTVNVSAELDKLLDAYLIHEGILDAEVAESAERMALVTKLVIHHEGSEHAFSTEYAGVDLDVVCELRDPPVAESAEE